MTVDIRSAFVLCWNIGTSANGKPKATHATTIYDATSLFPILYSPLDRIRGTELTTVLIQTLIQIVLGKLLSAPYGSKLLMDLWMSFSNYWITSWTLSSPYSKDKDSILNSLLDVKPKIKMESTQQINEQMHRQSKRKMVWRVERGTIKFSLILCRLRNVMGPNAAPLTRGYKVFTPWQLHGQK
ncbi:hypothetical protein CBL_10990 [Carabus blaptoides fortunei]